MSRFPALAVGKKPRDSLDTTDGSRPWRRLGPPGPPCDVIEGPSGEAIAAQESGRGERN